MLLHLPTLNMPSTFLDFLFGFGRENGGSISRRPSVLSLRVLLVAFCFLDGCSTSIMVGIGVLLLVTH